jgi:hypothetical protein
MKDADMKLFECVFRRYYARPSSLYFFFGLSMLGGVVATTGIFTNGADGLRTIPDSTMMLCLGAICFALFFPMFLVCLFTRFFFRKLDLLEAQLQRLTESEARSIQRP